MAHRLLLISGMSRNGLTRTDLLLVFTASLIPRLIGAFWLPNAFGDAYAYTEQIYYMRQSMLTGTFSLSNVFGFWLPLYQVICASISAVTGSPFYVPKLVSALCGSGACSLICLITWRLTSNRSLSLITTIIAALNPYQIVYSSSAMTDVPHVFFLLLCAYCCITHRWFAASLWALAAGLIRIESWTLIPLIPVAQFLSQPSDLSGKTIHSRSTWSRVVTSLGLGLLLSAGPLFWLFVSWKVSGSPWKYFEIRNTYIVETLASSPRLAYFSLTRISFDLLRLIYTANPVVMYLSIALLVATVTRNNSIKDLTIRQMWHAFRSLLTTPVGLLLSFFALHLTFLLAAYFTNNQPEIWPRYGLTFFTLGLPLAAERFMHMKIYRRFAYATAVILAVQFCVQLIDVTRLTVKSDPNAIAAEFLETQRQTDRTLKVYCEDGAIRVLSGIPLEEFRDQYNSPADDEAFLNSLRENQVRFVVYKDLPGSRLKTIVARIRAQQDSDGITLEEVVPKPRGKTGENVIVYRVHDREIAKVSKKQGQSRPRQQ
jgi:Dolichyl-phosphate-mannose-protein mannosyltransferase